MIYVCSLRTMPDRVRELRPGYLVSLLRPEELPPTPPEIAPDRHLRLAMDDISAPQEDAILPGEAEVGALIEFLRAADRSEPWLLHCMAGVSRSTAAALIALALDADGREREAAHALRHAAPHAWPNGRIIEVADALLGRGGRLIAAREAMGIPDSLPLLAPLTRVSRLG